MSNHEFRTDDLDETLQETFPASDAPANTVETGVRVGDPASDVVQDNTAAQQFELAVDGGVAFLRYERRDDALVLVHTEVPVALRGHHLGDTLVRFALETARKEGRRIVAICPFARAYLRKHPELTSR